MPYTSTLVALSIRTESFIYYNDYFTTKSMNVNSVHKRWMHARAHAHSQMHAHACDTYSNTKYRIGTTHIRDEHPFRRGTHRQQSTLTHQTLNCLDSNTFLMYAFFLHLLY